MGTLIREINEQRLYIGIKYLLLSQCIPLYIFTDILLIITVVNNLINLGKYSRWIL